MRHTINRQTFELNCSNEDSAKSVSAEIENFVITPFTEIIDRVISALNLDGRTIMIDRIEIDLGDLESGEIESPLTQEKFKQLLEVELKHHLSGFTAEPWPDGRVVGRKSAGNSITLFEHWLRHGDLPWWAEKTDRVSIESIFKAALSENPAQVSELIENVSSDQLFTRLISQLSRSSKEKLESLNPSAGVEKVSASIIANIFEQAESDEVSRWISRKIKQLLRSEEGYFRKTLEQDVLENFLEQWEIAMEEYERALPTWSLQNKSRWKRQARAATSLLSPHQLEFVAMLLRILKTGRAGQNEAESVPQSDRVENIVLPGTLLNETPLTVSEQQAAEPVTDDSHKANVAGRFLQPDESMEGSSRVDDKSLERLSQINDKLPKGFSQPRESLGADSNTPAIPSDINRRENEDRFDTDRENNPLTPFDKPHDLEKSSTEPIPENVGATIENSNMKTEKDFISESGQNIIAKEIIEIISNISNKLEALKEDRTLPKTSAKSSGDAPTLALRKHEYPNQAFFHIIRELAVIFQAKRKFNSAISETGLSDSKTLSKNTTDVDLAASNIAADSENANIIATPGEARETIFGSKDRQEDEEIITGSNDSQEDEEIIKLIDYLLSRLDSTNPVFKKVLQLLPDNILKQLSVNFKTQNSRHRRLGRDLTKFLITYPVDVALQIMKIYLPPVSNIKNKQGVLTKQQRSTAILQPGVPAMNLNPSELFIFNAMNGAGPATGREEIKLMKKLLNKLPDEGKEFVSFLTKINPSEMKSFLQEKVEGDTSKALTPDRAAATGANEKLYIENAGLCLIAVYLGGFFKQLDYLEKGKFRNNIQASRAIQLLQFIATGKKKTAEYQLQLNKILCGMSVVETIHPSVRLTKKEMEEAGQLLEAVLEHWKALKGTSIDGLRTSFLQRKGILEEDDLKYTLRVEKQGFDVLLNMIPWGYTLIKLPWMKKHLQVEW